MLSGAKANRIFVSGQVSYGKKWLLPIRTSLMQRRRVTLHMSLVQPCIKPQALIHKCIAPYIGLFNCNLHINYQFYPLFPIVT